MFKIGEFVVYGTVGVCLINGISQQDFSGKERSYYSLTPMYDKDTTIYAPVDSTKVNIRKIMSRQDAERFVAHLPAVKSRSYINDKERVQVYKDILSSGDCVDLAAMIKEIANARQLRMDNKKVLSEREQTGIKNAKKLLYGELAAALEIVPEQVPDYISDRVMWEC